MTRLVARGMNRRMSLLGSFKQVFVDRALRLMSDPRVTAVARSQPVMNAAMKALSVGGTVKDELGKATRVAAGVFGIATEEEVAALRSTIQNLEDTVAILEARAASAAQAQRAQGTSPPPSPSVSQTPAG